MATTRAMTGGGQYQGISLDPDMCHARGKHSTESFERLGAQHQYIRRRQIFSIHTVGVCPIACPRPDDRDTEVGFPDTSPLADSNPINPITGRVAWKHPNPACDRARRVVCAIEGPMGLHHPPCRIQFPVPVCSPQTWVELAISIDQPPAVVGQTSPWLGRVDHLGRGR